MAMYIHSPMELLGRYTPAFLLLLEIHSHLPFT